MTYRSAQLNLDHPLSADNITDGNTTHVIGLPAALASLGRPSLFCSSEPRRERLRHESE